MKRRRRRRRPSAYKTGGFNLKLTSVIIAMCLSVGAGYVTATQLIGPALGLESKQVFSDFIDVKDSEKKNNSDPVKDKEKQIVQDQIDVQQESGFALQYGSFSNLQGAQECAEDLKKDGIDTRIIEKDGAYKVIGELFDTKEEVRKQKELAPVTGEVFITEIP